jgi:hypothetical protein
MRIPAHVRILKQLCPEFETLNVDVPILLCASHFSEKTFYNFLETGAFPENFELNSNAQKELEKEPSKRKQKTCFIQKNVQKELKKKPSTRKEKTCFIQKKSIHKPSIYIRIAQHMKTAYSEFRKKGNPVWNLLALEVPFAINPREKLPTGRVITPEETEFEDTDSDDDLYKLADEQESLACGTKKNENYFQDNDEHDAMTKQNESVETDLSEKVSDNNIKTGDEEQDETGEQDNVSDNEEEDETGEQDNVSDNEEEDETGEPDNVSDNEEEDETGETGEPTNEDWKKMSNEIIFEICWFF